MVTFGDQNTLSTAWRCQRIETEEAPDDLLVTIDLDDLGLLGPCSYRS